jgi:FAD/FMN-containing dehydrogenase
MEKLAGLLDDQSQWAVLIELSSMEDEEKSHAQLETLLEKAFDIGLINDAVLSQSLQQSKDFWRIREGIPEAQFTLGTIVKHDISLPISELARFAASTELKLKNFWPHLQTVIFGHIGDGNLHYNIAPINPQLSEELEIRRNEINHLVHDEVYKYSGSFSAEHGIGQLKRDELTTRKSFIELELMRSIKKALDPNGIMNPGKVL